MAILEGALWWAWSILLGIWATSVAGIILAAGVTVVAELKRNGFKKAARQPERA